MGPTRSKFVFGVTIAGSRSGIDFQNIFETLMSEYSENFPFALLARLHFSCVHSSAHGTFRF